MAITEEQQNAIVNEINEAKQVIKTDGYPMSIGEFINLYKDGDVVLDPAFQRLFRWEDAQKTKLIESILIGIPIPEVFVAQKADGSWHVVDGVQRLSTILQLTGDLKDSQLLELGKCKYIPSLNGATWESLPTEVQRTFRRSKLNINIILTQNSDDAQYELFQRLNTGGTQLSAQEVRNCLILMLDTEFYEKLDQLKSYENFKDCISLKEQDYEKEEHMELILRSAVGYFNQVQWDEYNNLNKIVLSDFFDNETLRIIRAQDFDSFIEVFKRCFNKLNNCLGEKSFKKFYPEDGRFKGPFNVSVYEMLTVGICFNIDYVESLSDEALLAKIEALYSEEEVQRIFSRGVRAISRFKDSTEYSRSYFAQ